MDELENLLDQLAAAFAAEPRYFQGSEQYELAHFRLELKPILVDVVSEAIRILDQRYAINDEGAIGKDSNGQVELVHYTTIEALVSILGGVDSLNDYQRTRREDADHAHSSDPRATSSIRLYDAAHFNDPDEGEHLARSLGLHVKYKWLQNRPPLQAYVASFIHSGSGENAGDELVFWRTYGNDGFGCSISVSIPRRIIRRVLYGREGASQVEDVIFLVTDTLNSIIAKHRLREGILEELSKMVWKMLQPVLYLHKSHDYQYEREARVVEIPDRKPSDELLFECERGTSGSPRIRHYIEHDGLDARSILVSGSCITLGPQVSNRESAKLLLQRLLDTSNLYTQVKYSEIPYGAMHR